MAAEIGIASGKSSLILGVSSSGVKIGAKGGTERGHESVRRVLGAAQGWAAPPALLADWWWPSFAPLVILEASVALIFYIIFLGFIWHFNYWKTLKYKTSKK